MAQQNSSMHRATVLSLALLSANCTCVETSGTNTYACSSTGECSQPGTICCGDFCIRAALCTLDAGAFDAGADAGSCADSNGPAPCACMTGYQGASCRECAPGYQDHDANGSCLPTCASAALTCTSRGACADSSGEAHCECFVGYEWSGAECVWRGVLKDPDFTGNPGDVWVTKGSYVSEGNGVQSPARPAEGTNLTQDNVTMPPAETPDVFALTMRFGVDGGGSGIPPMVQSGVARVGSSIAPWSIRSTPYVPNWQTTTACLGEGAFDATRRMLVIEPAPTIQALSWPVTLRHLEIAPSSDCPAVGVVANGDLEESTIRWTLSTSVSVINGAVNGSKALRFAPKTDCEGAAASTLVSVPMAQTLPNAALQFSAIGVGTALSLTISTTDLDVATVPVTTAVTPSTVCLGDWARGSTVPIEFVMPAASSSPNCAVSARHIDLDNVTLVSDSRCATSLNPMNPGFEAGDLKTLWGTFTRYGGRSTLANSSTVDGGTAHGGSRYASLTSDRFCGTASLAQVVMIPPSTSSAGPAVHFWYRGHGTPTVRVLPMAHFALPIAALGLGDSSGWSRQTLCLNGARGGAPAMVQWLVSSSTAGTCDTATTSTWLHLDDVSLETDPDCPP